jgi:lipopolysaccharide transport system ATP-binding protein
MSDVAHAGRTVLFVSHNMPAILRLCPSAILLDKGRLVKQGSAVDVTNAYLYENESANGSMLWDPDQAPGSADVKLTAIRLVDGDGKVKSLVEVENRLILEVEYLVTTPGLKFRCGVGFNTQGVTAFTAMEPFEKMRDRAGRYISRVEIPPNLLAEGEYSISVSIFSSKGHKVRHVSAKNIFSFQVVDYITGNSARGDYAQNITGVVRPILPWNMTYEGAA